jgi:hypothetical protein
MRIGGGNPLIDNETAFPNDINFVVFLIQFRTRRGLELYEAFQERADAASPGGTMVAQLGLTAVR